MADQNNPRPFPPHDPRLGAAAHGGHEGASDPLAELARLIGQTDPFADLERERRRAAAAEADPHQAFAAPAAAAPAQARYDAPAGYAGAPQDDLQAYDPHAYGAYDPQAYAAYPAQVYGDQDAQAYPPGYEHYYSADGLPLDEVAYREEEEARWRRRRRIMVVAGLLGVAVIGSAGAYGYHQFFLTGSAPVPPPVIKAETTPAKVVPVAKATDGPGAGKLIYDRVNDRAAAEKVVPRAETPVQIKQVAVAPTRSTAYAPAGATAPIDPRPTKTIPVAPPRDGMPLTSGTMPAAAVGLDPLNAPTPKRVRTLTIRPDMTVVPNENPPPAPAREAAPEPPATRSAAPAPPPRAAPPAASGTRTASARPAETRPQRDNAPLSLSPAASTPAAAPSPSGPGAPLALAANPPAAPAPSRPTADGSYAVQVSSQRSEADARASFNALQSRYPNVLGGRDALVRRVDLGTRGIYYRALVGPFSSAEAAGQLCSTLKAAGGQCLVQKN